MSIHHSDPINAKSPSRHFMKWNSNKIMLKTEYIFFMLADWLSELSATEKEAQNSKDAVYEWNKLHIFFSSCIDIQKWCVGTSLHAFMACSNRKLKEEREKNWTKKREINTQIDKNIYIEQSHCKCIGKYQCV